MLSTQRYHWGDVEEIDRLFEEIKEYEDYRDYCLEKQYEAAREYARLESYWEVRCE